MTIAISPRVNIVSSPNLGSINLLNFFKVLGARSFKLSRFETLVGVDKFVAQNDGTHFPPIEIFSTESLEKIDTVDIAVRQTPEFLHYAITGESETGSYYSGEDAEARTEALKEISKAAFRAFNGDVAYNVLSNASTTSSLLSAVSAIRFTDFIMLRNGFNFPVLIPDWQEVLKSSVPRDYFEDKTDNEVTTLCFSDLPFGLTGHGNDALRSRAMKAILHPRIDEIEFLAFQGRL